MRGELNLRFCRSHDMTHRESARRRWLQFSLRSLLLLMLLAAVYVAGWVSGRKSDEPSMPGIGNTFGDYDLDGDLDLYIANESDEATLFLSQGDGTFVEYGSEVGR